MALPLKKVPLVNGDGNSLEICPKCYGSGTHNLASRSTKNEDGVVSWEYRNLSPTEMRLEKSLKKAG